MKEKKRIKKKIGVEYFVKAEVGDIEENTREVRRRRMRKEVVVCVQAVAEKNKFLVKFGDGKKKEMSYILLVFLSSK